VSGYGVDLAAMHAAGFTAIAEAAARVLLERLESPGRVLDLGCGDGTSAALLSHAGYEVHGIDLSPAAIDLARKRAPSATFAVGSFLDALFPDECDAVMAVGEVLGYALDPRVESGSLPAVLERISQVLRPGGLLLFDLAGPDRGKTGNRRDWAEGEGWAVLMEVTESTQERLTRRIVSFREAEPDSFRRSEESHTLRLIPPAEVLAALGDAGLVAEELPDGYGTSALPSGVTAFIGRRGS